MRRDRPRGDAALAAIAALFAAAALAPGTLHAQEGATSIEFWAGIPLPGEDMARVVDSGFDAGVGVEHRLTRRLSVLVLGARTFLDPIAEAGPGRPERRPPVEFWRATAGLELELTRPPGRRISGNPWQVSLNAGVGGGVWDLDLDDADPEFLEENPDLRLQDGDRNPVATVGLLVGPRLADYATLFFRSQVYLIFGGDARDEFLSKETLYTQTFGLRLTF